MIKAGIIGASGFTGHELVKILCNHPEVELIFLNSRSFAGKKVQELYSDFDKDISYTGLSIEEINQTNVDVIFLALPHGHSYDIVSQLNDSIKLIDLGADFRFSDFSLYNKVYDQSIEGQNNAVFGLSEHFKEEVKNANLVANPGCYVTASLLIALPIKDKIDRVVFDCISGYSGAGRDSKFAKDESILSDNVVAYKLAQHRHKYEIEQFFDIPVSFTPHVIPAFRGLMCTAHIIPKQGVNAEELKVALSSYYKDSQFVTVQQDPGNLHDVQNTNKCIIGGFSQDESGQIVIVSVIDNLIKGASGQAVQNMNIMFGLDEAQGLK